LIAGSQEDAFGTAVAGEPVVTLPVISGRLKLLTSPSSTGLAPLMKRSGIVLVAFFATSAVVVPPVATMAVT
jgi:hypothetical protein